MLSQCKRLKSSGFTAVLLMGAAAAMTHAAPDLGPVAKEQGSGTSSGSPREPAQDQPVTREREGATLTDVIGYFKATGDRATFFTGDGKRRYGGLENLNLERVTNAIGETPEQLQWSVSGMVTEFRGANYLLITRAILKSKQSGTKAPAAAPRESQPKPPGSP